MKEYKSIDKFELTGRGTIFNVINDIDISREDIRSYIGEKVKIDGVIYSVKGIESFLKYTIRDGEQIGILVNLVEERDNKLNQLGI